MRKMLLITFCACLLILSNCAMWHKKKPAPVSAADNTMMTTATEAATTQGLGKEDNLVGKDVGPTKGMLAKRSFYFAFDSNKVDPNDIAAIKAHAKYLLDHQNAQILVEGNTDMRGSREYNVALGQRRANAVENILKMQGVSAQQIRTVSYGEEKPVDLAHTEEAYRLNRRADLVYEK